jgi:hypothetical protein
VIALRIIRVVLWFFCVFVDWGDFLKHRASLRRR